VVAETIVYQMGKVGSSALVKGLNKQGVKAKQSHFLGTKSFLDMVRRFDDPDLPAEAAHHAAHQLRENLLLKNRILRAQSSEDSDSSGVNVVTLSRDPLDWYFANLVQNYSQYSPGIAKAMGISGRSGGSLTAAHLAEFLESVFNVLEEHVDHLDQSPLKGIHRIARQEKERDPSRRQHAIYVHATYLVRPHIWFDMHFRTVFDLDVLDLVEQHGGDQFVHEREKLRVLFLKFEALSRSEATIRDFFGLSDFTLPEANRSREKREYTVVAEARQLLTRDERFLRWYYDSRYCRALYRNGWSREFV